MGVLLGYGGPIQEGRSRQGDGSEYCIPWLVDQDNKIRRHVGPATSPKQRRGAWRRLKVHLRVPIISRASLCQHSEA
jgi:hypothetical protein